MSTDRYVSQSKFADLKGVSRQAVNKAVREGKLKLHGTGRSATIDTEDPLTIVYLKGAPGTGGDAKSPKSPEAAPSASAPSTNQPPTKPKPKDKPSKRVVVAPGPVSNGEDVDEFLEGVAFKHQKTVAEIERLNLHNKSRRGELIERGLVQVFIHKIHEVENGQWKPLGLKISSDVAAAFGIDDDEMVRRACDVIDKEVLAVLKQIRRSMNAFLKSIQADKIPKEKNAA